jgi:hypothetical protein
VLIAWGRTTCLGAGVPLVWRWSERTLVDRTSNFIGHWMNGNDKTKEELSTILVVAADRSAKKSGHEKFLDIFEDTKAIEATASAARSMSALATMAIYSDAYATVAVMCNHRQKMYANNPTAVKIAEMAAQTYAAAYLTRGAPDS